jgi:hypothetical protein
MIGPPFVARGASQMFLKTFQQELSKNMMTPLLWQQKHLVAI